MVFLVPTNTIIVCCILCRPNDCKTCLSKGKRAKRFQTLPADDKTGDDKAVAGSRHDLSTTFTALNQPPDRPTAEGAGNVDTKDATEIEMQLKSRQSTNY